MGPSCIMDTHSYHQHEFRLSRRLKVLGKKLWFLTLSGSSSFVPPPLHLQSLLPPKSPKAWNEPREEEDPSEPSWRGKGVLMLMEGALLMAVRTDHPKNHKNFV